MTRKKINGMMFHLSFQKLNITVKQKLLLSKEFRNKLFATGGPNSRMKFVKHTIIINIFSF